MNEAMIVFLGVIIMLAGLTPILSYILDTTFERHKKNQYTGDDDGNKR